MSKPQLVAETNEKSSRELVFEEIYRLKLERYALELEEKGYTVVPDAIDIDMVKHLREIIICQSADKSHVQKPDIETRTAVTCGKTATFFSRTLFLKN